MNLKDAPRLHFHRYEFKYMITGAVLDAVQRELELRLERDVHSGRDGSYFVRSHYFDTDGFDLFHEKLVGLRKRYKFRLRSYGSGPVYCDPLFLELKGKDDNLVYKHRLVLDPDSTEQAMQLDTSALADLLLDSGDLNGTGTRFVFDVFRRRISPSVVVDYHRCAFENRADPDFRATIDRDIVAFRAGHNGHPLGVSRSVSSGFQVLEIKFRYRLPRWFHRLIQELELKRVSFSKFAVATDLSYMNSRNESLHRILERRTACLN